MEPGAEASEVHAVADDDAMAMETGGAWDRAARLAVGAANVAPVRGEAVTAAGAAADGGADHMDRPVGHRRILNR